MATAILLSKYRYSYLSFAFKYGTDNFFNVFYTFVCVGRNLIFGKSSDKPSAICHIIIPLFVNESSVIVIVWLFYFYVYIYAVNVNDYIGIYKSCSSRNLLLCKNSPTGRVLKLFCKKLFYICKIYGILQEIIESDDFLERKKGVLFIMKHINVQLY